MLEMEVMPKMSEWQLYSQIFNYANIESNLANSVISFDTLSHQNYYLVFERNVACIPT